MNRRGFAMLAAMWLVVGIAVVALQFTLSGKERIALGMGAAERGWGRAETLGALAITQATLEDALLSASQNAAGAQGLAIADPLLGIDSAWGGPIELDSLTSVEVHFTDLGTRLNINTATEAQLRQFFAWILADERLGQTLSQTVVDWRDTDQLALQTGAESEDYIKEGLLALPTNGPFREVDDLLNVMGMTREIYDIVAPYLTTFGPGTINLNTAEEPVLRAYGLTDEIINNIIIQRGRGLRITSSATVIPQALAGLFAPIAANLVVQSPQFVVAVTARPGRQMFPVRLRALMIRTGTTTTIGWKQW